MKKRAEANRQYWEKMCRSALENYDFLGIEQKTKSENHTRHVETYLRLAFSLWMMGYPDKGRQAANCALEVANEWIQAKRPASNFVKSVENDSPYKELNLSWGQVEAYDGHHFATWLSTGTSELNSARIASQYFAEHYDWLKKGLRISMDTQSLSELMVRYVEAEQYEEALQLFHAKFKGNKATPTNLKFSASRAQTCAVLAEYCLGKSELEPLVKGALESRFLRATNWASFWEEPGWKNRLRWAYLRAKYCKNSVALDEILTDLRGY